LLPWLALGDLPPAWDFGRASSPGATAQPADLAAAFPATALRPTPAAEARRAESLKKLKKSSKKPKKNHKKSYQKHKKNHKKNQNLRTRHIFQNFYDLFMIFLCFQYVSIYDFFYVFFMIPRGASPQVWVGRGAVAGKVAARSVGCAVAPRELLRPKCRGRWEVTWSWPGQQTPSLPGLWPAL